MTARFKALLVALFLAGAVPPGLHAAFASDDAGVTPAALVDAGPGSALCPPGLPVTVAPDGTVVCGPVVAPSDRLDNPATNPLAAYNDARALQRQGWGVFALGVLLMGARGLQSWAPSHEDDTGKLGAAARWLATGARAFALAGVIATAGAAYNALALGGSWTAVAFAALGAGFALLVPATRPAPKQPAPAAA